MSGLASRNRYFAWGDELRPWPGELEYLSGARPVKTVKHDTPVKYVKRQDTRTFNAARYRK